MHSRRVMIPVLDPLTNFGRSANTTTAIEHTDRPIHRAGLRTKSSAVLPPAVSWNRTSEDAQPLKYEYQRSTRFCLSVTDSLSVCLLLYEDIRNCVKFNLSLAFVSGARKSRLWGRRL